VADAKLIIKPPHMQVRMKPGFWPDLPKMQQTIKDAGYKPIEDGVELRVTGKVVKQGEALAIEVEGLKTPITIPLVAATDDTGTVAHLREKHVGQTVDVEGTWKPAEDPKLPGTLAVDAIYDAGDKPHKD
jgi:hypothetical protein